MKISRRVFNRGLLASSAFLGASGCASNLATGRIGMVSSTIKQDVERGKKRHARLLQERGGEYEDFKLQKYVSEVGNKLVEHVEYKDFSYKFFVLDSPIVNAVTTGGGYVYVFRGLLALLNSEAELASILGHELGHVNARHISEDIAQEFWLDVGKALIDTALGSSKLDTFDSSFNTMTKILLRSYSRKQEFEADRLGIKYMSLAGYDPEAAVSGFEMLYKNSKVQALINGLSPDVLDEFDIMSTHPRDKERIKKAIKESFENYPANPILNKTKYLKAIDGLAYGEELAEGFTRGRNYVHPDMKISFEIPKGFTFLGGDNLDEGIYARNYKDDARIIFSKWDPMIDKKFKGKVKSFVVEGEYEREFFFTLMDIANKGKNFDKWEKEIVSSFKLLSRDVAEQVKCSRIKILKNVKDKEIAKLSKTLPYGKYNNLYFRVLNGIDIDDYMLNEKNLDLSNEEISSKYLKVVI